LHAHNTVTRIAYIAYQYIPSFKSNHGKSRLEALEVGSDAASQVNLLVSPTDTEDTVVKAILCHFNKATSSVSDVTLKDEFGVALTPTGMLAEARSGQPVEGSNEGGVINRKFKVHCSIRIPTPVTESDSDDSDVPKTKGKSKLTSTTSWKKYVNERIKETMPRHGNGQYVLWNDLKTMPEQGEASILLM
jgi:hypothetical protein